MPRPLLLTLSLALLTGCPRDSKPDDTGETATPGTDLDGDGHDAEVDCDDADASVHPGSEEACDGLDDDCDEVIDEGVTTTFYQDWDGDGWGDSEHPVRACELPSGCATNDQDCDDDAAAVNPGAEEVCDGLDDDCNGLTDEDDPHLADASTWYADLDADGFGDDSATLAACTAPSGWIATPGDCDDTAAAVNPDATEICNSVDDDCDGDTDEDDATDASSWFRDLDEDGWGDTSVPHTACTQPSGYVAVGGDCDDAEEAVSPAALERCNGLDTNCDGDDGCTDLNCDGWPDLVLPGYRSGTAGSYSAATLVYYFTGFGFSSSYRATLPVSGAVAGIPVDLDQDGFVDLLSLEHYDGSSYALDSAIY